MKKKMTLVTGLATALFLLAFQYTNAQSINEPAVKVIPTNETGSVKVIYSHDNTLPVDVKFYSEDGLVISDKINAKSFDRGFIKKYDIQKLTAATYWVEVSTKEFSSTFKLVKTADRKGWQSILESTTYTYGLLASR
jgi:hypothetical protein